VSIDRAKALKAAQKYLAKGQLDRAIVEYERMVADDPRDARSLLKLGDLYTRKGDNKGASQTYRKVAAQYGEQGFFLKAVAVYKQILKLGPSDIMATEGLAQMYEKLSLTSDAVSTYEQVVDAYTRANKPEKAVAALGRLAELDPENVTAWVRYAETLSKANHIDDAIDAFRKAADLLRAGERLDDYIKVSERLLFHSHEDVERARDLASIYIERGQAKAALGHLQTCFKADPKNVETLGLLAHAFDALGQGQKAVSVYKEIARIHADQLRPADEAEALRALLALDGSDNEARARLATLSQDDTLELVADADADEAVQVIDEEEIDEVLIVDDEPQEAAVQPIAGPLNETERQQQIARLMAECDVFLRYGLRDKVVAQLNRVLDLDPHHVEAREKLKDAHLKRGEIDDAVTQLLILSETVAVNDPVRAGSYLEEAAKLSPGNDAVAARLEELQQAGADTEELIIVDDEPDGIALGDAAADLAYEPPTRPALGPTETSLATALEGSEEPELLLEAADDDDGPELEHTAAPEDDDTDFTVEDDVAEEEEELPEDIGEAIEEADFYLAQKLTEEAREVLVDALGANPKHPALFAKLREIDALEEAAASPAPQRAKPATAAEPALPEMEDRSFAMAMKLANDEQPATQTPGDVAQVLQQFKEGVKRQVDKDDTATHYDLGIAYMEMGLHAEAIEEFKLCLDRPNKQCTAHTMIGLSYVSKGEMDNAIKHFKLALASPDRKAEEEVDLWFEIGNANELLGKASEALVWYEKVEERNPSFRDVALRIERLGVKKSPQQETDEFDQMFDDMIVKE
jgi:tetratricopeptide (TPR) repeat protein